MQVQKAFQTPQTPDALVVMPRAGHRHIATYIPAPNTPGTLAPTNTTCTEAYTTPYPHTLQWWQLLQPLLEQQLLWRYRCAAHHGWGQYLPGCPGFGAVGWGERGDQCHMAPAQAYMRQSVCVCASVKLPCPAAKNSKNIKIILSLCCTFHT